MGKNLTLFLNALKLISEAKLYEKIAFFVFGFLIFLAAVYPLLPYTYYEQNPDEALLMFSLPHPLGTDELGRDMLSRVCYGIGVSLRVGVLSAILATAFGTFLGIISGWFGGIVDITIMRLVDFFISIPDIILIVLISFLVGRGEFSIALAIALGSWLSVARVVRGEVAKIKSSEFVESALILGCSTPRIMFRHILPNILPVVITMLVLRIPVAILTESGLSFIGLGLKPPASSLGVLAEEGFRAISIYPRFIIIPSVFIILLVWSTNAIGEFISRRR